MPEASKQRRIESVRADRAARRAWQSANGAADPAALDRWYSASLAPRVALMRPADIQRSLGVSQRYAIHIKQGRVPHPRHFAALAKLAGVVMPEALQQPQGGAPT